MLVLAVAIVASAAGATEEVEQVSVTAQQLGEAAGLEFQLNPKANFDGNGYADLAAGAPVCG